MGNFFPPDYKRFPFRAGDLLVSVTTNGRFTISKILKVDRIELKKGSPINIQGQVFIATEDDFLLVVSAAYGAEEFRSMEEASAAAQAGTWTVKIGHVPNRTLGAAEGQHLVGHEDVTDAELTGYKLWREEFDRGAAGIF